jgi:hypothetical protein
MTLKKSGARPTVGVMDLRPQSEDVLVSELPRNRYQRQLLARRRRHRRDAWLAATAMVSALLALPLAQNAWHGPEVAAILAIAATAQFAGHRWAIAVIVLAELLLLPTVWPRAFLDGDLGSRVTALITLGAMVPGLLAMRRAAAALVVLTGQRNPRQMRRLLHAGLMVSCGLAIAIPWL